MVSPRDLPDILDVRSLPGCCRVGTDCFMAKIAQLPKTVETFLKSLAWLNFGSRASPRPGRRLRIVARNSRFIRATRELSYGSSHIVGAEDSRSFGRFFLGMSKVPCLCGAQGSR